MKNLYLVVLLLIPGLGLTQIIPVEIELPPKDEFTTISSSLANIARLAGQGTAIALERAQASAMTVRENTVYVEIINGGVNDLERKVDVQQLQDLLDVEFTTSYLNRASAWVPVERLLEVSAMLPPEHTLLEVVNPELDNQGPGLVNSDSYNTAGAGGAGLTIAVIDGGYAGLTAARTAGAAPTVANSTQFNYTGDAFESGGSHGTSCLETTFDHAPNAQYLIMKINSLSDMGTAVQDAINNGADVISHSLSRYNTGWDDGTGPACAAAQNAATNGVLFFTSAGNRNGTHWQGTYSDPNGNNWHNWAPFDEQNDFTINGSPMFPGAVFAYLQWDSPSTVDHYDLYLYEDGTDILLASSTNTNGFEFISYSTTSVENVYLAVRAVSANPPEFELFNHARFNTNFEYATATGSTTSPSNATAGNVVSVGALPRVSYNSPAGTNGIIAGFSSRGPTNSGNQGPDLCAPTNTTTTTRPGGFGGTSCATPNAAGAAAAFWSGHPQLSARGVRLILYRKAALYHDWGPAGADNLYGRGGLELYDYHVDNRYILRDGGNLASVPTLPYYDMTNVDDDIVVPANLRMIHLDDEDLVAASGTLINKPMLYRSIGGTLVSDGSVAPLVGDTDAVQARRAPPQPEVAAEIEPLTTPSANRFEAFPNPFGTTISVVYELAETAPVRLRLFDANGRLLQTLVDQLEAPPGTHQVDVDARHLAAGIYFCKLESDDGVRTLRLIRMN